MSPRHFFTIGHSTHTLERFLELLAKHRTELLADIRRFPRSRRHPQFRKEQLSVSLPEAGVEYHWFEALGGRRGKGTQVSSENLGLRNESFRNYADYMQTAEFAAAVEQLLEAAESKRTAYMCAEGLYWQCHRRLVSDFLATKGFSVEHIMPSGELRPHALTSGAKFAKGRLTYPAPGDDQAHFSFDE
jgi:uncharacterized protein (DUF488 family)